MSRAARVRDRPPSPIRRVPATGARTGSGRRRAVATAVVATVLLAGCGGGDDAPKAGTSTAAAAARGVPADDVQTLTLARLLERNRQAVGARFTGSFPVDGTAVPMTGRVDFRTGRGTLSAGEAGARPRRYVWTRERVYAQSAPGSETYTTSAPTPKTDQVHSAIQFLNLLSAETIDNTANIRDQDARFVRRQDLDGTPVDVFTLGSRAETTYWVDRQGGLLRQVQASLGDAGRVLVRITARGAQPVALPRTTSGR